jgi:acyl-CoA synthetase (AMP-forming)/AMP-acid ligase II
MRDDVVEARSVLEHTPDRIWEVIGTPELYPRFVPEISWCEVIEQAERGRGPRCLLRLCPQRDVLIEETIHAVVYRAGEHVVWCGESNQKNWVSLELHALDAKRTELVIRLMMPAPGPLYADLVAHSAIKRTLREVSRRIDRFLSGLPSPASDRARHLDEAKSTALGTAAILVRAGVLSPGRPDKLIRQLSSVAKWGATVAGGYEAAAGRVPDALALHDERTLRTFGQARERSNRLANALAAKGVQAGQRIALMCRNHAAMVESFIACGKLGVDVVLINTGLPAVAVAQVIGKHQPVAVFTDDEFADTIDRVPGDFLRLSTWPEAENGYQTIEELIQGASSETPKPADTPGRIVVLTSGTTGSPKGARRPTPKGLGTAAALLGRIPLRAGDRILVAAPLFHTWGLAAMQVGMALRASLSLVRRFDAEETLRMIAEHKSQVLFAVPIMLQRMLDLPARVRGRYDLSSLRIVASSGSALSGSFVTEFMDAFGDVLYNTYGSTEVSWASIADPIDLRAAPTTAGHCPPGTQVAILDESGQFVPPGVDGQIFVGNEMLFDGYTEGGTLPKSAELMGTGDVGYMDADGRLFVTGRADEMIVSGSENVFPRPVEEALITMPEVYDVAVVGVPDDEFGQRLAAYLVLRQGAYLEADEVREYIHQRLARFAVPRDVFFVHELPRNATGKVVKRLLNDDTWPVMT